MVMVSAVFAVVVTVSAVLSPPDANTYRFWTFIMLFIWGPVSASASFKELHDKTQNDAYLLLPASALEKVLSRLLLVTVGFGAWIYVFSIVLAWAGSAAASQLLGRSAGDLSVTDDFSAFILGTFVVSQSCYFLGAAWFRKSQFVKTGLVLSIGPLLLVAMAAAIVSVFLPDISVNGFNPNPDIDLFDYYIDHRGVLDALLFVGELIYFGVIPVFCWWVAWLRVRETQVSYGI